MTSRNLGQNVAPVVAQLSVDFAAVASRQGSGQMRKVASWAQLLAKETDASIRVLGELGQGLLQGGEGALPRTSVGLTKLVIQMAQLAQRAQNMEKWLRFFVRQRQFDRAALSIMSDVAKLLGPVAQAFGKTSERLARVAKELGALDASLGRRLDRKAGAQVALERQIRQLPSTGASTAGDGLKQLGKFAELAKPELKQVSSVLAQAQVPEIKAMAKDLETWSDLLSEAMMLLAGAGEALNRKGAVASVQVWKAVRQVSEQVAKAGTGLSKTAETLERIAGSTEGQVKALFAAAGKSVRAVAEATKKVAVAAMQEVSVVRGTAKEAITSALANSDPNSEIWQTGSEQLEEIQQDEPPPSTLEKVMDIKERAQEGLAAAKEGFNSLKELKSGGGIGSLSGLAGSVGGIAAAIGGKTGEKIGKIAGKAQGVLQGTQQALDGLKQLSGGGGFTGGLGGLGSLAAAAGSIAGAIGGKVGRKVAQITSYVGRGISAVTGLLSGGVFGIINGLGTGLKLLGEKLGGKAGKILMKIGGATDYISLGGIGKGLKALGKVLPGKAGRALGKAGVAVDKINQKVMGYVGKGIGAAVKGVKKGINKFKSFKRRWGRRRRF